MPVVRVVIPGLEAPDDHDGYLRGPRARRRAGEAAMRACVFVGPTLRPEDLSPAGDIAVLPPVAQGDVYRVAQGRPVAIGIIDGYFEGVLAVWHKEILWAMAEGIHVFGSASMGALRAAELHPFGMRGIGRIFEAYRAGELEDDDEVAVIHGPPETGYLALSEAMVNIRARLAAAERRGIIGAATRAALVRHRQGAVLSRPHLRRVCSTAPPGCRCTPSEIAALRAWLPQGRIDQKREDALAMLDGDAGAARGRARAHAGRLRARVDRGLGRRDGGCGRRRDSRAPAGPRRG